MSDLILWATVTGSGILNNKLLLLASPLTIGKYTYNYLVLPPNMTPAYLALIKESMKAQEVQTILVDGSCGRILGFYQK